MAQQEMYELLKKTKKWLTTKEMAKKLGIIESSASVNLRKLRKWDDGRIIKRQRPTSNYQNTWEYKLK